jgi:hypothetical protein
MHDDASESLEKVEPQPHFMAVACPYGFSMTEYKISDLVRIGVGMRKNEVACE